MLLNYLGVERLFEQRNVRMPQLKRCLRAISPLVLHPLLRLLPCQRSKRVQLSSAIAGLRYSAFTPGRV